MVTLRIMTHRNERAGGEIQLSVYESMCVIYQDMLMGQNPNDVMCPPLGFSLCVVHI